MAPKKASAFMMFAKEYQRENRISSFEVAVKEVDVIWRNMSEIEREPYKIRAKEQGTVPEGSGGKKKEKLTCSGTPIGRVEDEMREKQRQQEEMIKTIERTVKLAQSSNTLKQQKFHFIMMNYFTRLLNSDVYVPAEIAIIEFSLIDGVKRKFFNLINPEIALYGNCYEAEEHSKTTHNLPLPPNAMGERNKAKICNGILNFIIDKNTGVYPPLYTHFNAIEYITSGLAFLVNECNGGARVQQQIGEILNLNIYSIQELFFALKCAAYDMSASASVASASASVDNKPRNRFITDAFLEKDLFAYSNNIACDYHEEIDKSIYCALSQVCRWAFTFADYIGKHVNIQFLPGRHVSDSTRIENIKPQQQQHTEDEAAACASTMSMLSLDSFKSCDRVSGGAVGGDVGAASSKPSRAASVVPRNISQTTIDFPSTELSTTLEATHNPWRRRTDYSKPPDNFSVELPENTLDSSRASSINKSVQRIRGRGRGIAVFDDFKFP